MNQSRLVYIVLYVIRSLIVAVVLSRQIGLIAVVLSIEQTLNTTRSYSIPTLITTAETAVKIVCVLSYRTFTSFLEQRYAYFDWLRRCGIVMSETVCVAREM